MTYVVISHVLDDDAGVYRVVVGDQVVLDDEEVVIPVTDIVFDADDDLWFTGTGKKRVRRDDADVARDQQQIVAEQLVRVAASQTVADADTATAAAASQPRELPGAGRPLTTIDPTSQ